MNKEYISLLFLLGVILTFSLDFLIIHFQTSKKIGQITRLLGPSSHRNKNHTPTLGGIGFVLSFIILFIILSFIFELHLNIWLICLPLISYSLLGLLDDLIILIKKDNEGLSSTIKLIIQVSVAILYFYILLENDYDTRLYFLNFNIDLKFLYGIFILLLFTGFTNATNLTDGIDGLLGGCSVICLFGIFLISLKTNIELSAIVVLLISTLFGFLIWNYPKAKIFMGNTGAYGIGAFIVTISILLKIELYLFLFGGIFIIETISVLIQVFYFKISKGKRVFKMAPIHHHFELSGYKEKEVLHLFYIIEIIFVYIAILLII